MSLILNAGRDLEVKKHEAVVNARYKLSPLAIKFISVIIGNLKANDNDDKEYILKVKDFKELTGQKTKRIYELIDEALNNLLENPLTIALGDEKNSILKVNWISSAIYNEGEVSFFIDKRLKPYLLDAKEKYLKYKLGNILSLKSSYTIRIYEILKDCLAMNSKYGRKAELRIKVTDLREKLEIPKSYQYSSHIKKLILEKSKKELEKHTDIIFDYNEIKTGRKVTELLFVIKINPDKINELEIKENINFKSRRNFVALLRKNYAGNGKFFGYKTFDNKNYWLGINNKGLLYASGLDTELNSIESERIYDIWFNFAKMLPLYQEMMDSGICLNELQTQNLDLYMELLQQIRRVQEEKLV